MENKMTDKRLIDAFSGETHSEEEVGTFWSIADEEAYEASGGFDPFEE